MHLLLDERLVLVTGSAVTLTASPSAQLCTDNSSRPVSVSVIKLYTKNASIKRTRKKNSMLSLEIAV